MNDQHYIAIDWGSSNLRAFHIDGGELIAQYQSGQGVKRVSQPSQYPALIQQIEQHFGLAGERLPVILSGIVGSAAGWWQTPYQSCPVNLTRLDYPLMEMPQEALANRIYFCPGLCINDGHKQHYDVMRGEEVQLIGALSHHSYELIILPGTHSKWCYIQYQHRDAVLTEFYSVMTGELYELLNQHSLLVPAPEQQQFDREVFISAVEQGADSQHLIRDLFHARAHVLLDAMPTESASSYLSGLLIGHELRPLITRPQAKKIAVIASGLLTEKYQLAMRHLKLPRSEFLNVQEVTLKGYQRILESTYENSANS